MPAQNAIAIATGIGYDSIVPGNPQPSLRLAVSVILAPTDGGTETQGTIVVQRVVTSTAAEWKTDIVNAIKAWAVNPPGTPIAGYSVTRLIGLVDIATVVP